ncbi:glycosyltransferase [Pseudalkalibacillus caeni]|uniref:Glycosyltransferase n=1 Tax=Exobacillus caeni TaxID=2574798 RepID=A0A5R9F5N0_9BACL|nr:glycosyltransferase [Pseudalkalibacillus caeni]TLS35784.1 glycosyltransferase [Pseudalkalibacillus caeni]
MKPIVSIIVPIYNAEDYLERCLDSLLAQTLKEIEIITINDGSTDSSSNILKRYSSEDSRIKVIEKDNGGVSSARNEGILSASGNYIGFVDPDDWVEFEMYEKMQQIAVNEKADIVMCSYIREFKNYSKEKNFNLPQKVKYEREEVKNFVLRRLIGPLDTEVANPDLLDSWGTVWSKLYKADLIKENNIRFEDLSNIGTNEDSLFNIVATSYASSFVFINSPFYHYWRENIESITSRYKPNLLNQWFLLYDTIEELIEKNQMDNDYYLALNNRICLNTLGFGFNTISKDNNHSAIKKIMKIHNMLNDKRIRQSFMKFELTYFPIIWKGFYFCAKYRFSLGVYLMLITADRLRKMGR